MAKFITHTEDGVLIEQGDGNWKQLRVGLFTGTSMGDLVSGKRGVKDAREKAIYEVVAEIMTGNPVSGFKASKYMKEGIEKEPYARMAYQVKTDCVVDEIAFMRHEWMRVGASPDGLVRGAKRGVEFKSPKETTHLGYLLKPHTLLDEYREQVQANLWLSEYESWDLCSFHPEFKDEAHRLLIIHVPRDEAYIKTLESECAKAHAEVNLLVQKMKALAESGKEVS